MFFLNETLGAYPSKITHYLTTTMQKVNEIIKKAKRIPTPIATPVRHIKGILEAKYLNPKSTIKLIISLSIYN